MKEPYRKEESESAIEYNSATPADILAEDKIVGARDLGLRPQDVEIIPATNVFE